MVSAAPLPDLLPAWYRRCHQELCQSNRALRQQKASGSARGVENRPGSAGKDFQKPVAQ